MTLFYIVLATTLGGVLSVVIAASLTQQLLGRLVRHLVSLSAGVLLGSASLANALDRLDLIDEYVFLVHPRIAGHGPTLYQGGLPGTRRLDLVAARPLRNGAVALHYRRAG